MANGKPEFREQVIVALTVHAPFRLQRDVWSCFAPKFGTFHYLQRHAGISVRCESPPPTFEFELSFVEEPWLIQSLNPMKKVKRCQFSNEVRIVMIRKVDAK